MAKTWWRHYYVTVHDRKLKKVHPNTNCLQITMQKELGRYLLPVSRKKYKTDHRLKKYPPYDRDVISRTSNMSKKEYWYRLSTATK